MIRFFKKILPQNPVIVAGKPMTFQAYPSGVGLMAVDAAKHPVVIREFEILISRQKGGLVEISQQAFEDEKKKEPRPTRVRNESFTLSQVNQMRRAADRVNAELADTERAKRQLTPTISRSFKRPGMKFAGATANPEPGGTPPGQWRPGTTER